MGHESETISTRWRALTSDFGWSKGPRQRRNGYGTTETGPARGTANNPKKLAIHLVVLVPRRRFREPVLTSIKNGNLCQCDE